MDVNALIDYAVEHEDQTDVTAGGDFEYVPPKAGPTVGRFVGYIELGPQPQTYQGKPKEPVEEVRLIFELLSPAHNIKEVEINGEKKKISDLIAFNVPKKLNEKAKYVKIFNAMRYGREFTKDNKPLKHMAQMLGEAFKLNIWHNVVDKGHNKGKTYANLHDGNGAWGIYAPVAVDELAGTSVDISDRIPASLQPGIKIFLWGNPTKDTWDSLFIDGENTVKQADGTEVTKSKNWLQELIMSSTSYEGSKLQQMLGGVQGLSIKEEPKKEASSVQSGGLPAEDKPAASSVPAANDVDAAMASLGL